MADTTDPPSTDAEPQHHHHLPPPFSFSPADSLQLITQGAEALLYRTTFLSPATQAALKIRPAKPWRHPTLDKRLTKQRILAEARVLVKCRKDGVSVPAVLGLDWEVGWVCVEWIEGVTVKEALRGREKKSESAAADDEDELKALLRKVGELVGSLHATGVVHGDLTTSNMMIRQSPADDAASSTMKRLKGELVLIDFGLATQTVQDEDRAVDLYVLERAFGSTHPREEGSFDVVLQAYGGSYKDAKKVLRRLEDVRMRGRKKSMIG